MTYIPHPTGPFSGPAADRRRAGWDPAGAHWRPGNHGMTSSGRRIGAEAIRIPEALAPKTWRKEFAGATLLLAVVAMLTLSDSFLFWIGVNYAAPGGNVLAKLHPSTYLQILAFLTATVPLNPVTYMAAITRAHPSLTIHGLVMVLTMAYCTWRFGISGAAFINDSLLMPVVLAMTLYALPLAWRRRIFIVAIALVTLDSAIGIVEFMTRSRLIPYYINGLPHEEPLFRATSLMGHPLKNAAIVATFLCVLPVLRDHRFAAATAAAVMAVSLLAFGSRTAFMVCGAIGALWLAIWYVRALVRREFSYIKLAGVSFLVLLGPVAVGIVLLALGPESRIFENLFWDTSAQARTLAFKVFERVTLPELLFGLGPEGIVRAINYLKTFTTLTDIENFWILLLLNFGLINWLLFLFSFGGLLLHLLRGGPVPVKIAVIVFLIMASSNNSLAVKDNSLCLLMILVIGANAYAKLAERRYSPSAASAPGSNSRRGFAGSRGTMAPSPR